MTDQPHQHPEPAAKPAEPRAANGQPGRAKPLVGVTMGDPLGIGPEVVVKALADPEVRSRGRFVVYGIESVLRRAARSAGIQPFWFPVTPETLGPIDSGVVVADVPEYGTFPSAETPRPTLQGGAASLRFVDEAVQAALAGTINAVVTGPIHKVSWQLAGASWEGHTEKLADACNTRRVTMMFAAPQLKVALASTHVPLFELRNRFTIGLVFQPIDLLHQALQQWFGIEQPRLAVAGLNPHASDEGRFGDEERRIIEPALTMAHQAGINVEGPFAADSLFTPARFSRYDGFVAMYHDQGLIPVKLLAFHEAVNLTLGLPIVRTSVDHGTGFDIAGRNQADAGSMSAAIRLACDIAERARRTRWSESQPYGLGVSTS